MILTCMQMLVRLRSLQPSPLTVDSDCGQSVLFKQTASIVTQAYKITVYMNKSVSLFMAACVFFM